MLHTVRPITSSKVLFLLKMNQQRNHKFQSIRFLFLSFVDICINIFLYFSDNTKVISINFRKLKFSMKKSRGKCGLNENQSFSSYTILMTLTN